MYSRTPQKDKIKRGGISTYPVSLLNWRLGMKQASIIAGRCRNNCEGRTMLPKSNCTDCCAARSYRKTCCRNRTRGEHCRQNFESRVWMLVLEEQINNEANMKRGSGRTGTETGYRTLFDVSIVGLGTCRTVWGVVVSSVLKKQVKKFRVTQPRPK